MEIKILKEWPGLPIRRAIVNEDNELFLDIENETEREKTSLQFYFGKYTDENYGVLKDVAASLFRTRKSGLCALTCYATEEQALAEDIKPDELIDGGYGLFDSELRIENGRIIYKLESNVVPVAGDAWYDFGVATKDRVSLIRKKIRTFEHNGLMSAFFVTKHHYIDNVMPYEP